MVTQVPTLVAQAGSSKAIKPLMSARPAGDGRPARPKRGGAFEAHFGAPIGSLDELVAANTVTVSKLLEIAPAGTPDPTPGIYNLTMVLMAALLVVAFFANMRMRDVAERFVTRVPG